MTVKCPLLTCGLVAVTISIYNPLAAKADASSGGIALSYIDVSSLPSGVGFLPGYQDSTGTDLLSTVGTGTANETGNALDAGYPMTAYSGALAGAASSGPAYSSGQGTNLTNIAYDCLVNTNAFGVDFFLPWHYLVEGSSTIQNPLIDYALVVATANFYDGTSTSPLSQSIYAYGNEIGRAS